MKKKGLKMHIAISPNTVKPCTTGVVGCDTLWAKWTGNTGCVSQPQTAFLLVLHDMESHGLNSIKPYT